MLKFNKIYKNVKLEKDIKEKDVVKYQLIKLNLLMDDNNDPYISISYTESNDDINNMIENIYVTSYLDEMQLMPVIYNKKLKTKYSKNLFLNTLDPDERVIEIRLRKNDYKDAEKILKLYSILEKSYVCANPKRIDIKQYINNEEIKYKGKEELSLELYRKSSNENATVALSLLNQDVNKKYFTNK